MAGTRSTKFDIRGYNRIALVCSDMKQTTDFYQDVLGFPLVKTVQYEDGSQHFFFQVTDSDSLCFYWSPTAPPPAWGVTGSRWSGIDEQGNVVYTSAMSSAPGAFDHLAFDVPLEKQEEYAARLRAAGVEVTAINHHILYGEDGRQARRPEDLPPGAKYVDEFINSLYFGDPDGYVLEFAAYTRPLTEADVKHQPATAAEGAALLEKARAAKAAAAAR